MRSVLALSAAVLAPAAAWSGSVDGTVIFQGAVPSLPTLDLGADPACAALHQDSREPLTSEILVLGGSKDGGHTLANVLVQVVDVTASPSDASSPEDQPAVLDRVGCLFAPRVVALRPGQALELRASDQLAHDVQLRAQANDETTVALAPGAEPVRVTFAAPEPPFEVGCDQHPWATAWVAVLDHPYFDVTDTNGAFSIDGLPAGTYELTLWHERLGTARSEVTVPADGTATVVLSMYRPTR